MVFGYTDLSITKFHILDHVGPPFDHEPMPPTQKVKIEKIQSWGHQRLLGVIQPEDFKFHILDHVRQPVDREPTPPTQNGQSEKNPILWTPTWP